MSRVASGSAFVGRGDVRVSALVAFVALAIDLPRVCRTLSTMGDSAVFVSAAASWGVPQPPGYPLYTLIAFVSTKLPLFEVFELPFRVHLLSALFHAATVFVVSQMVSAITASRVAALAAGGTLAFSRAFFLGSHYAEVFPLNDLFTALVLFAALEVVRARSVRSLIVLAAVSGLASAHHQMIALLAPAIVVLLVRVRAVSIEGARSPRALALASAAFIAPIALFYSLILIQARRRPSPSWGDVHDLSSWWSLASRHDFGGLTSPNLDAQPIDPSILFDAWSSSMVESFGWLAIFLAALGVYALARKQHEGRERRELALFFGLAAAVSGPLFAMLNTLPVDGEHGRAFAERFFTMSMVPIAVFVGAGAAHALEVGALIFPAPIVRAAIGLSFVAPLATHARDVDLHDDRRGLAFAHDLFLGVPEHALVLVSGDALHGASLYACEVERRCGRDVIVFSPGQMHLSWRVTQLRRAHPDLIVPPPRGAFVTTHELVDQNLAQRPIFVSPALLDAEPALRESFEVLPRGLLVQLFPSGTDVVAMRAPFLEDARALAEGRCEGCAIRRDALPRPSLELPIADQYALAFENHARIARVIFGEESLAVSLEERALAADPDFVRALRVTAR